ncbi:MAG TPA: hypothetical protein VHX38_17355 [Pseudonocardiaceae bacterium]|jgi:hypothetical protein|nr:hypothetical protein [Pseudonocardiaceae bacterium]
MKQKHQRELAVIQRTAPSPEAVLMTGSGKAAMSTYLYGAMSQPRQSESHGDNLSGDYIPPPPSTVTTYAHTFAALVPAEVLALQAFITGEAVQTTTKADGTVATTIAHPDVLTTSFFVLLVVSVGLYFLGLKKKPTALDYVRALIAPIAFAGWMALQSNTAIDLLVPSFAGVPAQVTVAIVAVVLGIAVNRLPAKEPRRIIRGDDDQPLTSA